MNKQLETYKILGYDLIKGMLLDRAKTSKAKAKINNLVPFLNEMDLRSAQRETTGARNIVDMLGTPTIPNVDDIRNHMEVVEKEGILYPDQLEKMTIFISSCKKLKSYMEKAQLSGESIAHTGDAIDVLEDISEEINRCITGHMVDSNASVELKNIRRKIEKADAQIKSKLEEILKSKKAYCSENFVTVKNGRYTLPIKKEHKNMVSGSVIMISNTGTTYFIEPSAISKLTDTLDGLKAEEGYEVDRILYSISSCIYSYKNEIDTNVSIIEAIDFAFAKGKLSQDMEACKPTVTTDRAMSIEQGRHPMIAKEECVPIDFTMGENTRGVVITGPNTGGKTATLKLVGLFSIMAQSGLHVPAKSAGICMNSNVLCDIGDGQNITQNLSTFSSHILNIIDILDQTGPNSLVILDELGSGTDPTEGTGIAISILEELRNRNCLILATTHYDKVKLYAQEAKGLINARMTFDKDTLQPNYELVIGEAGESCALHIAKKLGLPDHMIHYAHQQSYGVEGANLEKLSDGKNQNYDITKQNKSEIWPSNNTSKVPKIEKIQVINGQSEHALSFNRGDSVYLLPEKNIGIVYAPADKKGNVGVQVRGEKSLINHKRLEIKVKAEELYPEDYDFSIIFDSVEHRKANRIMSKRYDETVEIHHD